jgi:ketosteroid isomerase-like protein
MKKMFAVCFFVIASMLAYGQGVEQTLTQMEKDWSKVGMSKANLAADLKTVDRMMADDWVGIDFLGRTITKAQSIENLKTGAATTQSIELGAIKVRVFGDTAVVAVSDTEKSTYNGKDSSGKYVWTDIYANRNGKWQCVASQSTKIQ